MSLESAIPPGVKRRSRANLLFSVKYLDQELLRNEPALNASRWPGYSGDIVTLNQEFIAAYRESFRDHFKKTVDRKGAATVPAIKIHLFNTAIDLPDWAGDRKSIHRLRQIADLTGLPYGTFISFCMDFVSGRGAKHIARPNQLISHTKSNNFFDQKLDEFMGNEGVRLLASYRARNPDSPVAKVPACVGFIGSRDEKLPACLACPSFKECGAICEKVAAVIHKTEIEAGKVFSRADKKRLAANAKRKRNRDSQKSKLAEIVQTDPLKTHAGWTM